MNMFNEALINAEIENKQKPQQKKSKSEIH